MSVCTHHNFPFCFQQWCQIKFHVSNPKSLGTKSQILTVKFQSQVWKTPQITLVNPAKKNDELIVMLFHPNLKSQSKAGHVNLYRFYLCSLGLKNYTENHHERNEWKLFPWTISGIADVYSYRPWRIFLLSFNRELMKRAPCPLTWFGAWIFMFWIKSQILTKLNLKIQISYHAGRSQIDDNQI